MTKWIERYRKQAEGRFRRLDAVLLAMDDEGSDSTSKKFQPEDREGAAS